MRYRIEGTTDEVTSCDCCGRTRLKHTVALLDTDTDQVRYMGTTCAAIAMKMQTDEVRRQAKQADNTRHKEAERQRTERAKERAQRWHAYLVERTGGIYDWRQDLDIFSMIQALGGHQAARAGFVE